MSWIDAEKIRQLGVRILKACHGHRPSEVMTAITLVSAFLAHDALEMSDPVEQEKYVAAFADTLRVALRQDRKGGLQ